MLCIVVVLVTSLECAKITNVNVIKTKNINCAIRAAATPPDLSNASGKFSKPAPNVALTIKKIVPNKPTPKK